jgi:homoserine kinase
VTFVDGPVRVSVPATSANLGPGFDSLGLALSLRDDLTARVVEAGLSIEVSGAGADEVPHDESHLVVRSMRAAFEAMNAPQPGLSLRCRNVIPHARGLGSSSAAIVAGVSLARCLVAGGTLLMDDDAVFQLAAELEGHPDNVAPAFFGGFVISGRTDAGFYAVEAGVDPRVTAVVFVPPTPVSTSVARGLLPPSIPLADAAANSGRTALLVAALAGQPQHLLTATRDFLHQDYREPAMPESLAFMRALRAEGVPAIVSGAGPTVLAFCDGPGCTPGSPELLLDRCPPGWDAHHLQLDMTGVHLS